jgi:hypothetical protein
MAAGKFSDPVLLFVLMVANNSAHTHEIASILGVETSPSISDGQRAESSHRDAMLMRARRELCEERGQLR